MNKRYILIARVSHKDQIGALPAQKLRLNRYASDKDVPEERCEYHEFDETAHKDIRTKFAELVEHIKKVKEPCIVVFDKIDRLTRDSSQDEVKILMKLMNAGKIELHFPNDALYVNQYSSAADLFRLGIGMALAKYYSDSISDNVKRRFEQMLSDGIWMHRAPMGYKNVRIDEKHTTIEVDKDRAPFIIRAFELRSTGMPYEVIATILAEEGLRSRPTEKMPTGNIIGKSYMESIINNTFYMGKMVHAGKSYPHRYEPLVSPVLFNKCLEVKDERSHDMTKHDTPWFTLKKLVKCGRCGRAVSSYYGRKQVYLRCSGTGQNSCGNINTAESLVIGDIASNISKMKVPEAMVNLVIGELKKRHDNQQLYFTHGIEQTRKEYDSNKAKMSRIYSDLLDGRITTETHDEIAKKIDRQQQVLNERLKKLTSDNTSFQVTASYLLDLAQRAGELFERSNYELRQKLLDYIFSNIELNDKKLSYTINDPFREIVEANKKALTEPNVKTWQGRQDLNLRHLVLETSALPTELLPYGCV